MLHEMLKPKSQRKSVTVKVGNLTFVIIPYCYKKVGMTENMRFKLNCLEKSEYNQEFDDIKEMTDYLNKFIFTFVIDLMV